MSEEVERRSGEVVDRQVVVVAGRGEKENDGNIHGSTVIRAGYFSRDHEFGFGFGFGLSYARAVDCWTTLLQLRHYSFVFE